MDMTEGPLLGKMIRFALPLTASGVLQLLFNAADSAVVGRFTGSQALAAVGSNGPLINLIVTLFMGLSIGTNVLTAQALGSHNEKDLVETVHTSIVSSFMFGVILVFLGMFLARPMLNMVGSPADVIDLAELYIKIYFLGMPSLMIYNYASAILRAVGDTKRPLFFMIISGVVNVVLNVILVVPFHMGVAGVGIATIVSETVSAFLVMRCLIKADANWRFDIKKARISKDKLLRMLKIGLPAGLQGASFSISNILIQSSINSFGSITMAGNAAAANIEGFCSVAADGFSQAAISFTGQCFGAKKYDRIDRILVLAFMLTTATSLCTCIPSYLLGRHLLKVFTDDAAVVEVGMLRLGTICIVNFIGQWMSVPNNVSRAMGYSSFPMINTIFFVCVVRVIWIMTVFRSTHSLRVLYFSYPMTWFIAAVVAVIYYLHIRKKVRAANPVSGDGPEAASASA